MLRSTDLFNKHSTSQEVTQGHEFWEFIKSLNQNFVVNCRNRLEVEVSYWLVSPRHIWKHLP